MDSPPTVANPMLDIDVDIPAGQINPTKAKPWVVFERRVFGKARLIRAVASYPFYDSAEKAVISAYETSIATFAKFGGRFIIAKEDKEDGHFYKYFAFPGHKPFLGISFMMEQI